MDKMFLTVNETAGYLNISRSMSYKLVNSEGFPKMRLGKKIVVPVKQLNEWIEKQIAHQGK